MSFNSPSPTKLPPTQPNGNILGLFTNLYVYITDIYFHTVAFQDQ